MTQKYSDRFIQCSNVGPHVIRGVRNAIQELETQHMQFVFKCTTIYSPGDSGPFNRPDMFPFHQKSTSYIQMVGNHYLTEYFREIYSGSFCGIASRDCPWAGPKR